MNYRPKQTCLYSLLYRNNEINAITSCVILAWTASSRGAAWQGDIGCGESESLSITQARREPQQGPWKSFSRGPIAISFRMKDPTNLRPGKLPTSFPPLDGPIFRHSSAGG